MPIPEYSKYQSFYKALPGGHAIAPSPFATPNDETFLTKRAALGPLLSPKHFPDLHPIIQSNTTILVNRIRNRLCSVGRINLHYAFRAASVDTITENAFDKRYGCLEREDFWQRAYFLREVDSEVVGILEIAVPGWMDESVIKLSELWWAKKGWYDITSQGIQDVKKRENREKQPSLKREPVFPQLQIGDVPDVDDPRNKEHNTIDVASQLTRNTLTITTYNVVANREIYKTLRAELTREFPLPNSELGFQKLEQLLYLIRLVFCFHVALHTNRRQELRLPCVVPESGAEFNGYNVAAGTIVSMSSWMMHRDKKKKKALPATRCI
ncbi:hypothetical protein GX48_00242 [Paracoccidioides brasiliensis]|nr:hypothetical protein GX48_00242 [Paracoccidioides brasiliensis]